MPKKELLYVGLRELRYDLTENVLKAGSGDSDVYITQRKRVLAVITDPNVLLSRTPDRPLPAEYYAAYYRHGEVANQITAVLARITPAGAERLAQIATEVEATEERQTVRSASVKLVTSSPAKDTRQLRQIPGMVKDSDVSISGRGKGEK